MLDSSLPLPPRSAAAPSSPPPPRALPRPPTLGPVVVVGGGMGGLMAAMGCRAGGREVVLVDEGPEPGGKLRRQAAGGAWVDAGPTVLTMPWVFERAFAAAGLRLADFVTLERLDVVARHVWSDGSRLDLFDDIGRNAQAIGELAGAAEARAYRRFVDAAAALYARVEGPFILGPKPTLGNMWGRHSLATLAQVARIDAHLSMRRRLAQFFRDPRLLQLFGRMSTYAGGAPSLTPATLNLIAHVETQGVYRVAGGMRALAAGICRALAHLGVRLLAGQRAAAILRQAGQVVGVRLGGGEILSAASVVVNAPPPEIARLVAAGAGPADAKADADADETTSDASSPTTICLSADTTTMVAHTHGVPLAHHTLFFAEDPEAEFAAIFEHGRRPDRPTVYICAQGPGSGPPDSQRLLCLTNAPSTCPEPAPCPQDLIALLAQRGLTLTPLQTPVTQAPRDFARRFAHSGGALYGAPPHGWRAFFQRPGSHTPTPGIYACGGHTHPGPGLPMTALGGQQAAEACLGAQASISP